MKRILSLTLVVVMLLSCLAVLSACNNNSDSGSKPEATKPSTTQPTQPTDKPDVPVEPVDCNNHVDVDGDFICDTPGCLMPVKKSGNYTYNTYMSEFPNMWNPHDYETATESEILGYTTLGFYTFDYNEDKTGFVVVPEMAKEMPIDVTSEYVGDQWGIDEDETGRAWKIMLRNDIRWQDGTLITAVDFVESAKRLLNPVAGNHRADSLYSGNLSLVGAQAYFYQGQSVNLTSTSIYKEYSTDIDANLIFTLAPPANGNGECAMRTMMGFPASYDAADCAAYLINKYLGGSAFTAEAAAAMEGKTLAEIKANETLGAAWAALIGWWQTEPNEELHFFVTKSVFPEMDWEDVGLKYNAEENSLTVIIEDSLSGFYLNYSLTGDFGLVHIPTYDACESYVDGIYTNTYGTSVETFMSYGPYKLSYFELDKKIELVTNDMWYGYTDTNRAGQYMTTRIVYDWISNPETAMEAFLQGKLDSKGLDSDYISQYTGSDRIYYTDGASTWFIALNPNEAYYQDWEATHEGYDKSIMTVKEFRMALSFSLDRQMFINTLDPMGSIAYGLFNNMICSNPDLGIMYREEDAAKDALLGFWGLADEWEDGWFSSKDEAIDTITGYDLAGAKNLFNQAAQKAIDEGIWDGKEKIQICIGTPNNTSKFYTRGYTFLVNCWTEAFKGTALEGKVEFTNDYSLGDNFGKALRANTVDMLFGVGWSGSQLNPYGLIGAYTQDDYRYDSAWNTSAEMMDFVTDDGVTLRASVLDWTMALEGDEIEAYVIEDGEATGDVEDYSCGSSDNKPEERIRLLAAIEKRVLEQYDMIPTHNQASASLLGRQVEYGNQEYVYGLGYGGLQYMTYNYTDEEWSAYVASIGGIVEY